MAFPNGLAGLYREHAEPLMRRLVNRLGAARPVPTAANTAN